MSDSDPMAQFRQTYIIESNEMLEDMEERLLTLAPDSDLEEINAIFRAAHSVKGGSGAFGFNRITNFTHILETLLDRMREQTIPVTTEAVDLLLQSVDILRKMINDPDAGNHFPPEFEQKVAASLAAIAEDPSLALAQSGKDTGNSAVGEERAGEGFQISFVPKPDLFASGNEPLLILRELSSLGEAEITVNMENIPPLNQLNWEKSYLAWDITLKTDQDEQAVHEVFEFVEDECDLKITPLGRKDTASSDVVQVPTDTAESVPQADTPSPMDNLSVNRESSVPVSSKPMPAATSIRVDVDKIDRLVNMVGELVITQALLQVQSTELPVDKYPKLFDGIGELSSHCRELQEAVMAVRMQPVKSVFARMPRVVRDTARKLGKEIRLEMSGEQTEIDKTIIEQLSDPLIHMIRNSVDHGIEMPDERTASGKPPEGCIQLSADNRGGQIVIEISDDGGGINREKVLAIAREKQVVSEDVQLSDEEVDYLIFAPGFSTASEVSDLSGRGVGMDVVRRNIESLGGTVSIENRPGEGSRFIIALPLTLAILDSMIVRVGAEQYVIPISNIIETLRPAKDEVRRVSGRNDVINVRGEFIPIIYLYRIFGIEGAIHDPSNALIVLAEQGKYRFGLVVDELINQQQVVIKNLEENADPIEGVSGATILGDGKVSLILDIAELQKISKADHTTGMIKEAA